MCRYNADENHNFKAEKDQVVQDLAKQMASPSQKTGKQVCDISYMFSVTGEFLC